MALLYGTEIQGPNVKTKCSATAQRPRDALLKNSCYVSRRIYSIGTNTNTAILTTLLRIVEQHTLIGHMLFLSSMWKHWNRRYINTKNDTNGNIIITGKSAVQVIGKATSKNIHDVQLLTAFLIGSCGKSSFLLFGFTFRYASSVTRQTYNNSAVNSSMVCFGLSHRNPLFVFIFAFVAF